MSNFSSKLENHKLNQRLRVSEERLLYDYVSQIKDDERKEKILWQFIHYSKHTLYGQKYQIGAANAITILNRARVSFSQMDLTSIRIPYANLDGAILDHTQLQNADLCGVSLRGAWICNTDFASSKMADIEFGQRPFLQFSDNLDKIRYTESNINHVVYSPNKLWLVISEGATIHVYDANTYCRIHYFEGYQSRVRSIKHHAGNIYVSKSKIQPRTNNCQGHTELITCLVINLDNLLATGGDDKVIKLWDLREGQLTCTLESHTGGVKCLCFAPDNLLASGSEDRTVRLWDIKKHCLIGVLRGHTNTVEHLIFCSNNLLASGSWDNTIRLWNVENLQLIYTFEGHTGYIRCMVMGPDSLLASGSNDQMVRLWDIKNRKLIHALEGHNQAVTSLAFNHDHLLASGSNDHTIRVWNIRTGELVTILDSHNNEITSLAISTNDLLVSASRDKTIRLWNIKSGNLVNILRGHTDEVECLALSPDNLLVSGSGGWDHYVRLWDIKSNIKIQIHNDLRSNIDITCIALSEKNQLISGSRDGRLLFWNIKNGDLECALEYEGSVAHKAQITHLISGPDNLLASASKDGTIKIWNTEQRNLVTTIENHEVTCLSFSAESCLAFGTGAAIQLWNTKDNKLVYILRHSLMSPTIVTFGPDYLLASETYRELKLWDLKDGKLKQTFKGHRSLGLCQTFGPNNQLIFPDDEKIVIWNIKSDKIEILNGHTHVITCLIVSKDGYLVSASKDCTICIWDLKDKRRFWIFKSTKNSKLMHILKGHRSYIISVALGSNNLLASGSTDGTIRLWNIKTGRCLGGTVGQVNKIIWYENTKGLFLITEGDGICYWKVDINADIANIILVWSSNQMTLTSWNVNVSNTSGLSEQNLQILKQSDTTIE